MKVDNRRDIFLLIFIVQFCFSCVPETKDTSSSDDFVFEDNKRNENRKPSSKVDVSKLQVEAFEEHLHSTLRSNTCVSCHGVNQSPQFATNDPTQSWNNLYKTGKVNLDDPARSRIVKKIVDQNHNCGSRCAEIASEIQASVEDLAQDPRMLNQQEGNLKTRSLKFPDVPPKKAQTEYGRLILSASQSHQNVLNGRYQSFIDSNAIGQSYIDGGDIPDNPITQATRTLSLDVNGCEYPTQDKIDDYIAGAVQINESPTHVNSRTRTPPGAENSFVKDGYAPFSYQLRGYFIRPDKRIEFARALINKDYVNVQDYAVKNGRFDSVNKRPGVKAPALDGDRLNYTAFRFLPHFAKHEEVFDSNGNFLPAGNFFEKDDGTTEDVYTLFREGAYEPNPEKLYKILQNPDHEDLKLKLIYPKLKQASQTILNNKKQQYFRINDFTLDAFLATNPVEIELKCPSNWNPKDKIDPESSGGPYKSCDPEHSYPGRYSDLTYALTTPESSFEPLTYTNALQKLTLNSSQTAIVPATPADIATGNWFHRIDLFSFYFIDPGSRNGPSDFQQVYLTGEPGGFTFNESFSRDNSYSNNGILQYPLNKGSQNLDTRGIFVGAVEEIDDIAMLENFEKTLYPELQAARCVECHSSGDQPRFAQSNASLALGVLQNQNLIDFTDPGDSLRGRARGVVHNCDNGRSDPRFDCSKDTELRNRFIEAIRNWRDENEKITTGDGVLTLSERQRTPGVAKYDIKITEQGYYNVWMRLSAADNDDKSISYRILDSSGTPVRTYSTRNGSPEVNSQTCEEFNFSGTGWRWITQGREDERSTLDFVGRRLVDEQQEEIPVPDNRVYWMLTKGDYTLEVFEQEPGSRLNLIALNKVDDFSADGRLNFQPDLIKADEKYISNYKRNLLKYDLSHLIDLDDGEEAYFQIEISETNNGQTYQFTAPKIVYNNSSGKKLKVKGIRGLINDRFEFTDSTYTELDYTVGKGRVMTYSPLVTLVPNPNNKENDVFTFTFEELSIVENADYSEINPNGVHPALSNERKCLELDLFVKTVKPILKNIRVVLENDFNGFINDAPGSANGPNDRLQTYTCTQCHNETHPFFKMTTFEFNDDLLCRQALSRVDFSNFYQSTIVRGINGSNNHPKFFFLEELFYEDSNKQNWDRHNQASDYIDGFTSHPEGYKSRFVHGPFPIFKRSDFSFGASTNFNALNEANKEKARMIGSFKGVRYIRIPEDPDQIGGYNDLLHFDILGEIRGEKDIVDPNHIPNLGEEGQRENIDPLYTNRRNAGRAMYVDPESSNYLSNPRSYSRNGRNLDGLMVNFEKTPDNKVIRNIDYRDDMPGVQDKAELSPEFERLRNLYREAVINWVRAENRAYEQNN